MTDWRHRRKTNLALLALIALVVFGLVQLGNWQMRRLDWKNALIHAVETRTTAAPQEAPGAATWPDVRAETHTYLRVRAEGDLLHERELAVKAVTEIGPGFWIMTPLRRANGEIIWINRGFVPPDRKDPESRRPGTGNPRQVTGLLRMTEPDGTLLETNDPASGRWYSRDVVALSASEDLPAPAPYFIDADHEGQPGTWPRGGLTRVKFRNNHLQYALTWYAMAGLLLVATAIVIWRARRPEPDDD